MTKHGPCSLLILLFLIMSWPPSKLYSFQAWSTPVQITSGVTNDVHPAFTNDLWWPSGREEWLAFSRNGKDICLVTTTNFGADWLDSVHFVTHDSADNDYPSLTRGVRGYSWDSSMMLVWQTRRDGNLDVYYSHMDSDVWSVPTALSATPFDERSPQVAPRDSGFGAVWEREGRILFSEFKNGVWSPPEQVTPNLDSGNTKPTVTFMSYPAWHPIALWQRKKPSDTSHAILFSRRISTGWTNPDILVWQGDNQGPKFYKLSGGGNIGASWETNANGEWRVWGAQSHESGGNFVWEPAEPLSMAFSEGRNASVNGFFVLTRPSSSTGLLWYSAATWEVPGMPDDSIALASFWGYQAEKTVAAPASSDRNPDISSGVFALNGMRVWSVWENNNSGSWKLYGSNTIIQFGSVREGPHAPQGIVLSQNYPNPFNPGTTISFTLQVSASVSLKVYDVLGRELATLVNERRPPGDYKVPWDAGEHPSGVYFYRLISSSYSEARKMILMR